MSSRALGIGGVVTVHVCGQEPPPAPVEDRDSPVPGQAKNPADEPGKQESDDDLVEQEGETEAQSGCETDVEGREGSCRRVCPGQVKDEGEGDEKGRHAQKFPPVGWVERFVVAWGHRTCVPKTAAGQTEQVAHEESEEKVLSLDSGLNQEEVDRGDESKEAPHESEQGASSRLPDEGSFFSVVPAIPSAPPESAVGDDEEGEETDGDSEDTDVPRAIVGEGKREEGGALGADDAGHRGALAQRDTVKPGFDEVPQAHQKHGNTGPALGNGPASVRGEEGGVVVVVVGPAAVPHERAPLKVLDSVYFFESFVTSSTCGVWGNMSIARMASTV